MNKNYEQAMAWISQAERDLRAAKILNEKGIYETTCFMCQQSAEKALKGLLYYAGLRGIVTHSVYKLYMMAKQKFNMGDLEEASLELDKQYVPPRYPDSFPEGAPFQYYSEKEAKLCMEQAGLILTEAKKFVKK